MTGATHQFRRATDPQSAAMRQEMIAARASLGAAASELERPTPVRSLLHGLLSWAMIGVAVWALRTEPWLAPIMLFVIGSRQRALGNLMHDSVHFNVLRAPLGRVIPVLLAAPIFEDFTRYRRLHMQHHAFLGDPERDPDYFVVDTARRTGGAILREWLFGWRMFRSSLVGDLPNLTRAEGLRVLAFWSVLLAGLAALDLAFAATFAAAWMLARATSYHLIKTLAEVGEHNAGLPGGSIAGHSRTYPSSVWNLFFHPYADRYHLAHHYVPRVPMLKLGRAHPLLKDQLPEYRWASRYESYFSGPDSVVGSFNGRDQVPSPSQPTAVPAAAAAPSRTS